MAEPAASERSARAAEPAIESIWTPVTDTPEAGRGGDLPEPLARRFPGGLSIPLRGDRPSIAVNFVSTIDGVVALAADETSSGGAEISGYSEPDRFVMAVLRALSDTVVVGGGTARAGAHHEWTPRHVEPGLAAAFDGWRASLGLAPQPTTVVVTGTGTLDPRQPGLCAADVPVIVATTRRGAARLADAPLPPNMRVEIAGTGDTVTPDALLDVLRGAGFRVALCEGGPHLFGELLGAGLVDELFLTLAPQILGRGRERGRLGLVEGTTFGEGPRAGSERAERLGRWASLAAVRRAGDHLFLRYRFGD